MVKTIETKHRMTQTIMNITKTSGTTETTMIVETAKNKNPAWEGQLRLGKTLVDQP